jgi:predicted porin
MKKTLVALAALASVSAFAQSTVEIYGTLDISQVKLSGAQAGLNNTNTLFPVSSTSTGLANTFARQGTGANNMGFRGTEDLGGGMYAGFDLQTGALDQSTGSAALAFSRESNLKLGSKSWGEFKIGRSVSTVCDIGCSFDYNFIGSGNAANLLGISAASMYGSSRRSDQIQFKSLASNGLQVWASVVQRGDANADSTFATSGGAAYTSNSTVSGLTSSASDYKNRYTLGAVYTNGPLRVAGSVETVNKNDPSLRTSSFLAAEYNFGLFTANIQSNVNPTKVAYTKPDGSAVTTANIGTTALHNTAGTTTGKGTVVGIKVPQGAFTYGVQYANNDETGVKATEMFVQYALSKRTTLFAYNTKLQGTVSQAATNTQTGTTSTAYSTGIGALTADPTIFAFGMRHQF